MTTHHTQRTGRPSRGERGSATLEAVLVVPSIIALLALVMVLGRIQLAQQRLDQAAAELARTASLARDPATATGRADAAAAQVLANSDLDCVSRGLSVDTSGFSVPVGTPALVEVRVTCAIPVADVALPGLPGTITRTSHASSPLDRYRER